MKNSLAVIRRDILGPDALHGIERNWMNLTAIYNLYIAVMNLINTVYVSYENNYFVYNKVKK